MVAKRHEQSQMTSVTTVMDHAFCNQHREGRKDVKAKTLDPRLKMSRTRKLGMVGEFTAAQAPEKAMAEERGWFMEDEKKPQVATAHPS